MTGVLAVVLGAVPLVWPALVNGYPLVFSDTGGFLHQTLGPLMLWDKPYVYGPFLHAFHWRVTLWGPLTAQALIVSHLLWLAQRCLRGTVEPLRHVAIATAIAALTPAPFSVALLMPDVFAPVVVVALALLGFARERLSRGEHAYLVALAALAIAVHLAHLPVALALVMAAFGADILWARRRTWPLVALPLVLALGALLVTNAVGHGRASLSPHGATFLLARLQSDGPASATLKARCPEAGWYLCAFVDRLPMDSDAFLWAPDSPVNRDPEGRARFLGGALISAEAAAIVGETLRRDPVGVAAAITRNTVAQLALFGIGDTLGNEWLAATVARRLADGFPAREAAAFAAGAQAADTLRGEAAIGWAARLHGPALALALLALVIATRDAWRARDHLRLGFLGCIALGLLANAAATGGLSKPHPRYQARLVWLLPAAALLLLPAPRYAAGMAARSAPR